MHISSSLPGSFKWTVQVVMTTGQNVQPNKACSKISIDGEDKSHASVEVHAELVSLREDNRL